MTNDPTADTPITEDELAQAHILGKLVRWIGQDDDDDNFGDVTEITKDDVTIGWTCGATGTHYATYGLGEVLENIRLARADEYDDYVPMP